MHADLTQGTIKEHILKLAIPSVVGYFFHTLFNVTDTYFAGLISTEALSALSLSASVFFMILAIGIGMSEALSSLVGNALGEKDIKKAQHTTLNGLLLALLLSIFLSLVGILTLPLLVEALGDPSYAKETYDYIHIIIYGIIFFIASFFLNALLNATGDTKSFRNVLIFTAILNIFLDYAFIHYFDLGVKGIALATIIAEVITMLYLFYKVRKSVLWSGFLALEYDFTLIKRLLKNGFPPSVNMFMMAFGMYIITYFVAPFGKEAVAAFGIGMRIEQLFLMPVVGLNVATLAIVAQNNGAKTYERIDPTMKMAIKYGWIISTLGVMSFLLFADYMASLMTTDLLVIEQTALYLRVAGLASYGFVIIFIYIAMLQGIEKPAIIFPVSVYRQVIAPVIVLSLLSYFDFSLVWIWIALNAIIFSSALFLWIYGERKLKLFL